MESIVSRAGRKLIRSCQYHRHTSDGKNGYGGY
jgi:hypothetical protein